MPLQVAAILLAAGRSRRMGSCKQLLPLGDRPVIVHCLERLIGKRLRQVVVVVGPNGDGVERAISHLPVTVVRNPDPASDMAGSLRVALRAVPGGATGVLVALADYPLVTAETYRTICRCHDRDPESIVIPLREGRKGHPVLFPRHVIEEIATLPTLREVVRRHPQRLLMVEVPDDGVLLDMDTPGDYRRVARLFAAGVP